jgi:hypothetical protein
MKTQPSFKELATAFVAAGSPGASDRERPEAEQLATGLPLQYLTEAKALKVLVRDLDTGTVIGLIRRWSERRETAVRPAAILSWTGYRFARSYHLCVRWLPGSLRMEGRTRLSRVLRPTRRPQNAVISIHLMSLEEQHEASRHAARSGASRPHSE